MAKYTDLSSAMYATFRSISRRDQIAIICGM